MFSRLQVWILVQTLAVLTNVFCGFPQSFQANFGAVSKNMPQLLPSSSSLHVNFYQNNMNYDNRNVVYKPLLQDVLTVGQTISETAYNTIKIQECLGWRTRSYVAYYL
jgi:hypothetical protein